MDELFPRMIVMLFTMLTVVAFYHFFGEGLALALIGGWVMNLYLK